MLPTLGQTRPVDMVGKSSNPWRSAMVGGVIAWGIAALSIGITDWGVRHLLLEDLRTNLGHAAAHTASLIAGHYEHLTFRVDQAAAGGAGIAALLAVLYALSLKHALSLRRPNEPLSASAPSATLPLQLDGDAAPRTLAAGGESAVFDIAALRERVDADEQFMDDLIGLFVTTMEERIITLLAAVNRDDATAVATEAHAIRGAAANVDAYALSAAAAALERSARAGVVAADEVFALRAVWRDTRRHPALYLSADPAEDSGRSQRDTA